MVRTLAVLAAAEKRKHEKLASAGAMASSSEGEPPWPRFRDDEHTGC